MNNNLKKLTKKFNVICLDTETTGLDPINCKIIDLGVCSINEQGEIKEEVNSLIKVDEGEKLEAKIVELTHITDEMLETQGEDREKVREKFTNLIKNSEKPTLIIAYNTHFDQGFISRFFKFNTLEGITYHWMDAMTLYKEVAPYPHKLEVAIPHYNLQDECVNSHRAYDDAYAALRVFEKELDTMEYDDVLRHINVFGYNAKYPLSNKAEYVVDGKKYPVLYIPQSTYGGQKVTGRNVESENIIQSLLH